MGSWQSSLEISEKDQRIMVDYDVTKIDIDGSHTMVEIIELKSLVTVERSLLRRLIC